MMSAVRCALLVVGLAAAVAVNAGEPDPLPERLIIERVTVLPMSREAIALADTTVLIEDGRIAAIAPASTIPVTRGVKRIDGRGKWLIPGLTDMHAHLGNVRMLRLFLNRPDLKQSSLRTEDLFTPFIANGVVRIMDMQPHSRTALRPHQGLLPAWIQHGRACGGVCTTDGATFRGGHSRVCRDDETQRCLADSDVVVG